MQEFSKISPPARTTIIFEETKKYYVLFLWLKKKIENR